MGSGKIYASGRFCDSVGKITVFVKIHLIGKRHFAKRKNFIVLDSVGKKHDEIFFAVGIHF